MKRTSLFFAIDVLAFVLFLLLTTTGILVRYTLPPGSGHFRTLWGMDRHDWGQIHFWIAVVFLAALALHVFFHWKWVVSMVKGRPKQGSGKRVAIAAVSLLALGGLLALPFLAPIEQSEEIPHKSRAGDDHGAVDNTITIDGSMTLRDAEHQTGVPVRFILDELGLPSDVSTDEKLGQLKRTHGFELETVREIIEKHR